MPRGTPRSEPGRTERNWAADERSADLLRSRTERPGQGRGVAGVENGGPGDENGVDGGEDDEHDGDHEHGLSHALVLRIGDAGSSVEAGVLDDDGDDPGNGDCHAESAQGEAAGSPGGQPHAQQQRNGQAS